MVKKKSKAREWLEALLLAVTVSGILYFICWPVNIDGPSMEPSLITSDRVLISRIYPVFKEYQRGDVILCDVEIDDVRKSIIKRIAGQPGDSITIENGVLHINGEKAAEGYLTKESIELTLGPKEYYILGDNPQHSYDSRNFGSIDIKQIIGKAIFKLYPFNKMGRI